MALSFDESSGVPGAYREPIDSRCHGAVCRTEGRVFTELRALADCRIHVDVAARDDRAEHQRRLLRRSERSVVSHLLKCSGKRADARTAAVRIRAVEGG